MKQQKFCFTSHEIVASHASYLSEHLELPRRESRDSRRSDPRVTVPASLSRPHPLTSTTRSEPTAPAAARPASHSATQLASSSVWRDPWVAKEPSVRPVTRLQPPRSRSSRRGRRARRSTPMSVIWLQAVRQTGRNRMNGASDGIELSCELNLNCICTTGYGLKGQGASSVHIFIEEHIILFTMLSVIVVN